MKKSLYLPLFLGFFLVTGHVDAQFRSIPGVVTDSFKTRYPTATDVNWSDKLSNFQATFLLGKDKYTAKFDTKGVWLGSSKRIAKNDIPAAVKDGLSKSKYASAEWVIKTVTIYYNPGNVTQYGILVQKSDIQKKNLLFSSEGQLLKDNSTL
ncbi:MAG TPA: PepSY-like domain-containing protein [Puia sp.]|nr:PepSY-like domain-containing protein [Puia sp.]